MTIPIVFLTAVLKKSAVRHHYAGGEAAFRVRYPYAAEDRYLFGLASMSGQEMDDLLAELAEANIELTRDGALAGRTVGVFLPHPGIGFSPCSSGKFAGLEARLMRDDPSEMAREGEEIVRFLMAHGFSFEVPNASPADTDDGCQAQAEAFSPRTLIGPR